MVKRVYFSFLLAALILAVVAAGAYAYFSDTATKTLNTTTATVKVGDTSGFPLAFSNLVPGIYSDWNYVTIENGSTIPVDLYTGVKHRSGACDLKDKLWVEIVDASKNAIWSGDVFDLFASWVRFANDMPAGATWGFYMRAKLDPNAGNELQNCNLVNDIFIHATQWDPGTAPSTSPYEYVP